MTRTGPTAAMFAAISGIVFAATASADWTYNGAPYPNASIQTKHMLLEVQCDRIRFAPAGDADARDIARKNGLSFRFLVNGNQEVAAFQAGRANSFVQIVDDSGVEILFSDESDYAFVLDQIAENAALTLSMVDQDISYGMFDLAGSGAAIRSLRTDCRELEKASASLKAPVGLVYCGGGGIKRKIEFVILDDPSDQWDARVTVNGDTQRAMTSYSYSGDPEPLKGFMVALLAEDRSEFLVFRTWRESWLEFGDYRYDQCD